MHTLESCYNILQLRQILLYIILYVLQVNYKISYILKKTQMKPKIVGDRTFSNSVPTCDDKYKYYRKQNVGDRTCPNSVPTRDDKYKYYKKT